MATTVETQPKQRGSFALFALTLLIFLSWGWWTRNDIVLSAEEGLGYALGIIGVSAMVLLLTYPIAKHSRSLQAWIPLKHWFRVHMMLGLLGPLAILYHCNFQWGSLNSSIALACMLLVVLSGLIGRYLYGKVHMGIYGQKAQIDSLLALATKHRNSLTIRFSPYPEIQSLIEQAYAKLLPADPKNIGMVFAFQANTKGKHQHRRIKKFISKQDDENLRKTWHQAQQVLDEYLDTLRRLAQLRTFDRLLSLWHILHLPFFAMMLFTAVIHIWAVHTY